MENSRIIYLRRDKQPTPLIILSSLFIIVGVYLIASSSGIWWQILIGIIFIIASTAYLTLKEDIYYDAENNSILSKRRLFSKVREIKKPLDEIHYIAVVKVKATQNLNVLSISTQISETYCNVNLVFKNSKLRFLKLCSENKENAIKKALEISEIISVPILDSTTSEKKWLNKT